MNYINIKKAAMFGLDARIALAIFGALSIISGAALYSAIQKAQSERWRQYFVEIVKASEQYYLDTGSTMPRVGTRPDCMLNSSSLVENTNSLNSWNGPYLQGTSTSISFKDNMTRHFNNNAWTIAYLQKISTWTTNSNLTSEACVVDSIDCSEWIVLAVSQSNSADEGVKTFNTLDELVDKGDGALSGKVRFNDNSHGYIMYQGIPRKRTF